MGARCWLMSEYGLKKRTGEETSSSPQAAWANTGRVRASDAIAALVQSDALRTLASLRTQLRRKTFMIDDYASPVLDRIGTSSIETGLGGPDLPRTCRNKMDLLAVGQGPVSFWCGHRHFCPKVSG